MYKWISAQNGSLRCDGTDYTRGQRFINAAPVHTYAASEHNDFPVVAPSTPVDHLPSRTGRQTGRAPSPTSTKPSANFERCCFATGDNGWRFSYGTPMTWRCLPTPDFNSIE